MSDSTTLPCDCCTGATEETPALVWNRPGLSAISYRVGTHPSFKASMLAALSRPDFPATAPFTTREDSDFSIAGCFRGYRGYPGVLSGTAGE